MHGLRWWQGWALGLVPAITATAALAACSHGAAPSEPAIASPPSITSLVQIPDRQINRFLPTAAELLAIETRTTARINQCLRDHQVAQRITDTADLKPFINALIKDRRARSDLYGFFDTDTPDHGYGHVGIAATGYEPLTPTAIPSATLTLCAAGADQANQGFGLTMEDSRLPVSGPPAPRQDSRFITVAKAWSRCMEAAGYHYAQPLDALTDRRWRVDGPKASALQVSTARADIACKRQTNLVGTSVALLIAYDHDYITTNLSALKSLSYRSPG